jgi:5-methylcytosine-specific restriction endonuclease McrA
VPYRTPSGEPPWAGPRAQRLAALVLARDGYRCRMTGPDGLPCLALATTADHVIPIAEGGAVWDPANMRAACAPHNYAAGARLRNARTQRRPTAAPSRAW